MRLNEFHPASTVFIIEIELLRIDNNFYSLTYLAHKTIVEGIVSIIPYLYHASFSLARLTVVHWLYPFECCSESHNRVLIV